MASVPLCPVVCPPTPDSPTPGNLGHPCGPKPINIMMSGQSRASSLGLCEEPDISFSSFFCCHCPLWAETWCGHWVQTEAGHGRGRTHRGGPGCDGQGLPLMQHSVPLP